MKFYILDCFAEAKYQGNPLAVLIPDRPVSDGEMLQIAKEMGFSETAFILSGKQDNGGYDVRIFTPDVEVPFAGHPSLGTAWIIRNELEGGKTARVLLNLRAGQIPVAVSAQGMTMTQNQPVFGAALPREMLAAILCLEPEDIREDYPVEIVSTGLEAVIVPLRSRDALARCRVDHLRFQRMIDEVRKCNILAFFDDGGLIRARLFMDDPGFLEDPATGSANGNLAGYFLCHDYFGSSEIEYQVSQGVEMGRPSTLYVRAEKHAERYTIQVGGRAFVVAEGEWR